MLELEEALARILASLPPAASQSVSLSGAEGRVLAETISSPIDLPPFDNSAMDGFAVSAGDLAGAARESPVCLRLAGRVAAGENFTGRLNPGTCVRLFTGSPLPAGADAVVMQEDTQIEPSDPRMVSILEPVKPWENVRFHGEDIKRGDILARQGEVLGAGLISLLAATGRQEIQAGKQPTVALVATGSELKEPGQSLQPGQIYESNRAGLAVLARRAGAIPKIFPLVPDAPEATRTALEQAFGCSDLVVTSGGASVGEMDFIRSALQDAGGDLQFWKVAIKPGRPFIFGRFGSKLLFGLPGNPVSALITFLLLVRPALLRWQGATDVSLPTSHGILSEPLSNSGQRRHFIRVKIDRQGKVFSAGVQASHILSSLAAANGFVDVPPGATLPAGTMLSVIRLD